MTHASHPIPIAYAGHYKDIQKLRGSASGGAASAISEAIIQHNGCVFGVTYSNNYKKAEYMIAKTLDQLDKLKSSKYLEVSKYVTINDTHESIYSAVQNALQDGNPVLFIGLGCTIFALKSYLKSKQVDDTHLYTVSLICHGQPPATIAEQYTNQLEHTFSSKLCNFNTRYKKQDWKHIYIRAEFENGTVYETPLYCSDFGYAFSIFSREACYQCKYKGDHHPSDIVIGDYWGIQAKMPGYNKYGVSLIIPQTPKGQQLLNMVDKASFLLVETDYIYALMGGSLPDLPSQDGFLQRCPQESSASPSPRKPGQKKITKRVCPLKSRCLFPLIPPSRPDSRD